MTTLLDLAKGIHGKSAERLPTQAAGAVEAASRTRYGTVQSYADGVAGIALDAGNVLVRLPVDTACDVGDRVTVIAEGGTYKVLNVRHVAAQAASAAAAAAAAETDAQDAKDAALAATNAASAASSAASAASAAAAAADSRITTEVARIDAAVAAVDQYFWHDNNGCHVATAASSATAATNSLWNSEGLFFRRGANYLMSLLDSGLTFFDGSGNGSSHVTAQFTPTTIYLGKGSDTSIIDMCGSVFQLLVTAGQGILQSTKGVVLRLYGDSADGVGVGPTGEAIMVSGTGVRINSGATTSVTSTGSITVNSTGGITYVNGSSVRTSSPMMHKGGAVYLDASNLTDKTVPSAQTNGDANLYFRDSANTTLAFFGQTFQPDGRQGVRFYANRTPAGGSSTTNGCALYVGTNGERVVTFNSATPWRFALRVGACGVRLASNTASKTSTTKLTLSNSVTTDVNLLTLSSGGIKCVEAGTVKVSAGLYCTGMTGAGGLALVIRKGSTTVVETVAPVYGGIAQASLCGLVVQVSANDVIYLYARSTTAGTLQADACYLTVEYLS